MPKRIVQVQWDDPDNEEWLKPELVIEGLNAYLPEITDAIWRVVDVTNELSASEALFGFVGWLTTRSERVVMSGRDDAATIADLVSKFCEVNQLLEPREEWSENLVHPE